MAVTIPTEVMLAAKDLVAEFGPNFVLLGDYKGRTAYEYVFPGDPVPETGFPIVFLFKDGSVEKVTGREGLAVALSFDSE